MFRSGAGLHLRSAHIAWRPVPLDGEPVVGQVPGVDGLYLAVTRSGVTLAPPVVGRLLAQEVVDEHWHGAAPHRLMVHIAMNESDDQHAVVHCQTPSPTRSTPPPRTSPAERHTATDSVPERGTERLDDGCHRRPHGP